MALYTYRVVGLSAIWTGQVVTRPKKRWAVLYKGAEYGIRNINKLSALNGGFVAGQTAK
jgi:hypothetical protein